MKPVSYSSKVNDGLPAFSVFYQNVMSNDYQYSNLFKLKTFALTKGKVRSVSFTVMPLYTVLYIQLMKPKQLISSNTLLNPSGTNFETPIVVQNLSTD